MQLPEQYNCEDRTRIDLRYITYSEAVKRATNIVMKKLYVLSTKVLSEIREVEMEDK